MDAARTSPYQMYQYWLQTADADVVRFLKLFTFLDRERIEALGNQTQCRPEAREVKRVLAAECTAIVHGAETVRAVEAASRILFSASNEVPSAAGLPAVAIVIYLMSHHPKSLKEWLWGMALFGYFLLYYWVFLK